MEFGSLEFVEYYENNLDIEMEKKFAKSCEGDCSGMYRKYFGKNGFFCIDIAYEGYEEYWFALCVGTIQDGVEYVDKLYESDNIKELTEDLVYEYEKMAKTIIENECSDK